MMLFHLMSIARVYVTRATNWLLVSAFALDQMTETLLEHARRHYWHPMVRLTVRKRNGKTVLQFKNLE